MSRLVLDTNCLIQIISPKSKYHLLIQSILTTTTQSFSYFFEMIIPYIIKNSCNFAENKI